MAGTFRCFVGLPLPRDWGVSLSRVAGRLSGRLASRISWTRPDNWHITLKFLGEVEQARVPEITSALVEISFAPLALRLGGAGTFSADARSGAHAPRTLWVALAEGDAAVSRLAEWVEQVLAPLGFGARANGFRAHVTLGRVKAPAAGEDWGLVDRELGAENFAPALVGEMVLWRSILGPAGPKYVALEGYPARGNGGGLAGGTA
ncbi:MAG: RNA 2',3'-cyclic phosphodiesterase [Humidesulfovibrio sp.]|nr:RNA 2',3'-cyclic phosphodiesterase [Humidesulfovibrio sp.]